MNAIMDPYGLTFAISPLHDEDMFTGAIISQNWFMPRSGTADRRRSVASVEVEFTASMFAKATRRLQLPHH